MNTVVRRNALVAVAGTLLLSMSACGGSSSGGGSGSGDESASGGGGFKIGLLLPDQGSTRYEEADRPSFEAEVAKQCADCEVLYANADRDSSKQQQQAESLLAQGVSVLVIDPVESAAAGSTVNAAMAQGVPVIGYDRGMPDSPLTYFVSFDSVTIGQQQAQSLVDEVGTAGPGAGVIVLNGSPTDAAAGEFKKGAHDVLDQSGVPILAEFDTPGWDYPQAQNWLAGQITQFEGRIAGVYAANDGLAAAALASLSAAGVSPIPPITGQDAELAAVQRIVAGQQYMSVYKDVTKEGAEAARVAVSLARGEEVSGEDKVEPDVPATLFEPQVITIENVQSDIVDAGVYAAGDICTAEYAAACTAAGIK